MIEIAPSLHRTGLPISVLTTIHLIAGANLRFALELAQLYKTNVLQIDRLQTEIALREKAAKAALAAREAPVKAPQVSKRALALAETARALLA